MAFHSGDYDVYAILGDPKAAMIWEWSVWKRLLPSLDPLMKTARGTPAVRSTQYFPNQAGQIKFGRLGWKETDHQKWTHKSPVNKATSKTWLFVGAEAWAPSWSVCEKEDRAPEVFLSVANEALGAGCNQELAFNPVVIFAVNSDLVCLQEPLVSSAISTLQVLLSPKLAVSQHRKWGRSANHSAFTNSIQDLAVSGLFKPGPRHKGGTGTHLLEGKWLQI